MYKTLEYLLEEYKKTLNTRDASCSSVVGFIDWIREREDYMISFCSESCNFLSINEKNQKRHYDITNLKLKHRCVKYNKVLEHGAFAPKIIKCLKCVGEETRKNKSGKTELNLRQHTSDIRRSKSESKLKHA